MAETVYILCFVTSVSCAWLLFRAYRDNKTPLLFWSGLCFSLIALNNLILVVDLIFLPTTVDLHLYRSLSMFLALSVLVGGLVWRKA